MVTAQRKKNDDEEKATNFASLRSNVLSRKDRERVRVSVKAKRMRRFTGIEQKSRLLFAARVIKGVMLVR